MGRKKTQIDQLEMHTRRRGVEKAMLRGHHNQSELAIAFGVSEKCIHTDVKAIRANWANNDYMSDAAQQNAAEMVARFDYIIAQAYNSFELSTKQRCKVCRFGLIKDEKAGTQRECHFCNGTEWVTVPGDVNYLNTIRATLVEIGRIRGVYPGTTASRLTRELEQMQLPDGTIKQTVREISEQVPIDMILKARGEYQKLLMADDAIKRGKPIPVLEVEANAAPTDSSGNPRGATA